MDGYIDSYRILKGSKRLNQMKEDIDTLIKILCGIIFYEIEDGRGRFTEARIEGFKNDESLLQKAGETTFYLVIYNADSCGTDIQVRIDAEYKGHVSAVFGEGNPFSASQLKPNHVVQLHSRLNHLVETIIKSFPSAKPHLEFLAQQAG